MPLLTFTLTLADRKEFSNRLRSRNDILPIQDEAKRLLKLTGGWVSSCAVRTQVTQTHTLGRRRGISPETVKSKHCGPMRWCIHAWKWKPLHENRRVFSQWRLMSRGTTPVTGNNEVNIWRQWCYFKWWVWLDSCLVGKSKAILGNHASELNCDISCLKVIEIVSNIVGYT